MCREKPGSGRKDEMFQKQEENPLRLEGGHGLGVWVRAVRLDPKGKRRQ